MHYFPVFLHICIDGAHTKRKSSDNCSLILRTHRDCSGKNLEEKGVDEWIHVAAARRESRKKNPCARCASHWRPIMKESVRGAPL